MAGELQHYFIVEKGGRYYVRHDQWAYKVHVAAFLDEETATRISRRYPGSHLSRMGGYDITFRTFEELEPDANQAIEEAILLAKLDGQKVETIQVTVEKAYHAAK